VEDETREERVGVFRRRALDHLLGSAIPVGGPIPSVIPYKWPLIITVTLSAALFIASMAVIRVDDAVSGKNILRVPTSVSGSPTYKGLETSILIADDKIDAIHSGQPAVVSFGDGMVAGVPTAPAMVTEVASRGNKAEGNGLTFPVKVQIVGEPSRPVPSRDMVVTVRIKTGQHSALAIFIGQAK